MSDVTQEEALVRVAPWAFAALGGATGVWALLKAIFGLLHSVSDLTREVSEMRADINGIGGKVNAMSERLVRTDAILDAQTHRIDEHARKNEQNAGQGYAEHLRELCDQVESIIRKTGARGA